MPRSRASLDDLGLHAGRSLTLVDGERLVLGAVVASAELDNLGDPRLNPVIVVLDAEAEPLPSEE
jgi:hypothetical protein